MPQGHTQNSIGRRLTAFFLALVLIASLLAWAVGDKAARDATRGSLAEVVRADRALYIQVCLRNNITKAIMRVNEARRLRLVRDLGGGGGSLGVARQGFRIVTTLQPLLNCERTFLSNGTFEGVVLPQVVEQRYLRLVGAGWVPELRGDRIVGKHRAETAGNADF